MGGHTDWNLDISPAYPQIPEGPFLSGSRQTSHQGRVPNSEKAEPPPATPFWDGPCLKMQIVYRNYIGVILGIMEKKMETTIVYWVVLGLFIVYRNYIGIIFPRSILRTSKYTWVWTQET